ncbi:hypothetical protein LFM09_35680 [Lentzea alba]|uniref:DUF6745 domain-containing protein n=1 Tax=Lentzea alba TaxID=2714351 RepID=UPI0039BFADDE
MSAPGGLEARSSTLRQLRTEWLRHALSTAPADRPAAEEAVAQLYAATGRPPPEFIWTRSPAQAAKSLPAKGVLRFDGEWQTVEAQIAALAADLRYRLIRCADWFRDAHEVSQYLRTRLRECLVPMVKSTMPAWLGLGWTGQHEAAWLAELDVHRRVLGARFNRHDRALLDVWATLARSTGWWWPREDVCVIAERPTAVHVDEDSLPHNDDGPAVTFADGSCAYAWHGSPLTPISSAPDPANPGFHLTLHDLPGPARLLVAVNGSVERDGTRRRYGLRVPRWFQHPVQAVAWTYGLEPDQYLQLLRRT